MPGSVLIVCAGNICRSPLAEAMMKRLAPGLLCSSAGLVAAVGRRAHPFAEAVAAENGLDLRDHRSQRLSPDLAWKHDLILAMETGQRCEIINRYPSLMGRVFHIAHWTSAQDIPDPMNMPRSAFEDVYRKIDQALGGWKSKLHSGVSFVD